MGERVRGGGTALDSDPLPHNHRGNALPVDAFERDGCGGEGTTTQIAQLQKAPAKLSGFPSLALQASMVRLGLMQDNY